MSKRFVIRKRGAQLAILLNMSLAAFLAADVSWGQVAGFAQSRSESAATAESGPRRIFANLNPFRQTEKADRDAPSALVAPPVSQPVITASRANPPVVAPQTANPTPSRSASPSSVPRANANVSTPRPAVAPARQAAALPSVSASKKSSGGGVASALLDELEEDLGDETAFEPKPKANAETKASKNSFKTTRRSLRSNPFPSTLELLVDESDAEASAENEDEVDELGPAVAFDTGDEETGDDEKVVVESDEEVAEEETASSKSRKVRDKTRVEPLVEEEEESGEEESAVVAKPKRASEMKSKKLEKPSVVDEDVDALESRLDAAMDANSRTASTRVFERTDRSADEIAAATGRAPNVEIKSVGPKKLVVGQESRFRVTARNLGDETARKLVVTTEIPESVSDVKAIPNIGSAAIRARDDQSELKTCVWNVDALAPGQEIALDILMTPTRRASFGLVSRFEFERSAACAEVEVQEPILEALIEGRDSIEWGVEDKYRLRLRNIGNGDAENVELRVSADGVAANQKIGVLRAGEEKVIEMAVKTVSEEFFLIDAQAVGSYGVETRATKRVETLRGKLDVEIDAPDLQFVQGEFVATIRVKNVGEASLQNVDVVAQIPSGVEILSCSNQARRNPEKRRVYWVAPFIRPDEELSFVARCRVDEPGEVSFEAVGVDQTGLVAQARADVLVESIAVLAMRVNAPKEPVAVGKTCVYELVIENNGTRDARDVNSGIFLGAGIKPLEVEDGMGYVYPDDSKALFKKIELLRAGETAVFRVKAEALEPGNQKVQAMLQSTPEDVSLLSEETTYCYSRERTILGRETMTADKDAAARVRK